MIVLLCQLWPCTNILVIIYFTTRPSFVSACTNLASRDKNTLVCIFQKLYLLNSDLLEVFLKIWLTKNQLKLNDDKTEVFLFPFSSSLKLSTVSLPDSITLGSHNIPFSDSARNLGFILGSNLSMKKYVIKICQATYFELKRLSSIRRFITEDVPKILVTSYILSRLDYCNCLLMGTLILSFNLSKKFKVSNLVFYAQSTVTVISGQRKL